VLTKKLLGMFLEKDDSIRRSEGWESSPLSSKFLQYAAYDVLASRLVFEKCSKLALLQQVQITLSAGTRVAILVQKGGEIAAYGTIAEHQPKSLGNVRVKVPSQKGKTKSGALTFGQLQNASSSTSFQIVCLLSHLILDLQDQVLYF
jgi:hypothetical protein